MNEWVNQLTSSLQSQGQTDAVSFVVTNASMIATLGKESFVKVLGLFQSGEVDAAILQVDAQMEAADIIQRENDVADLQAQDTAAREQFISDLKRFGLVLAPVLLRVLLA